MWLNDFLYVLFLLLYIIAALAVASYDTVNFSTKLSVIHGSFSMHSMLKIDSNSFLILPFLVVSYTMRPPYSLEH